MKNPLANPVRRAVDQAGGEPEAIWKSVSAVAGILGAVAARQLVAGVRRRRTRRGVASVGAADDQQTWASSLIWAGSVGVAAAVGRLLAQVVVAETWKRRRRSGAAPS